MLSARLLHTYPTTAMQKGIQKRNVEVLQYSPAACTPHVGRPQGCHMVVDMLRHPRDSEPSPQETHTMPARMLVSAPVHTLIERRLSRGREMPHCQ